MREERTERWIRLCELAATEQDPKRLLTLVREINRLLEENEQKKFVPKAPENPIRTG